MTLVTGTVQDLGYDGMDGTLWARPARFRSDGQVVLAPERKPYKITGGVVSAALAPGPAVLELQVGSHARDTFEVVIPEEDITLADLLDTVFPWEPEQVSQFVALRELAVQAKTDAETAAGQASTAAGTATTAAQQTGQDRSHVDQVRALLDETYDESQAGMALPPRLMESALSATYLSGKGPEGSGGATVGPNLITSDGWTLGAGWSGDFATGFTKTAGGIAPLTWTPPFATGIKNYIVSVTVDTPTDKFLNYLFAITLGGSFPMVMYEGEFFSRTYTRGIRSTANGNLQFIPEPQFAGTVSGFTVREVTSYATPQQTFRDSDGQTVLEMRSSTPGLNNIFIGKLAGRANVSGHQSVVIGQGSYGHSTSGFWNAAIGYETLRDNVNGTRNCTLGVFTLERNITGHRNVAIGPYSMRGNTHGKANVSIGVDTMWLNETGDYNIAIGQAALGESVTGDCNIAVGRGTLAWADGMSNHIAIGDYASWALNTDMDGKSLAIGTRALRNATKGGNFAIGDYAGNAVTTGTGHTLIGHDAGRMVTDALNDTFIGRYAGRNITGEGNTAVGMNALGGNAAGNARRNTGVGYGTLTALQAGGDFNTAIGASAGATLTTGQNNILIGNNAQGLGPTDSGYLNIGNTIYGYLTGNRRIGIGVTNPTAKIHLAAGVAGVNGAPLKFTTGGVLTTTPEPGAFEFDGTNLYITNSLGVRKTLALV